MKDSSKDVFTKKIDEDCTLSVLPLGEVFTTAGTTLRENTQVVNSPCPSADNDGPMGSDARRKKKTKEEVEHQKLNAEKKKTKKEVDQQKLIAEINAIKTEIEKGHAFLAIISSVSRISSSNKKDKKKQAKAKKRDGKGIPLTAQVGNIKFNVVTMNSNSNGKRKKPVLCEEEEKVVICVVNFNKANDKVPSCYVCLQKGEISGDQELWDLAKKASSEFLENGKSYAERIGKRWSQLKVEKERIEAISEDTDSFRSRKGMRHSSDLMLKKSSSDAAIDEIPIGFNSCSADNVVFVKQGDSDGESEEESEEESDEESEEESDEESDDDDDKANRMIVWAKVANMVGELPEVSQPAKPVKVRVGKGMRPYPDVPINYRRYSPMDNKNAEVCVLKYWDVMNKRGRLSAQGKPEIYIDSNAFSDESVMSELRAGDKLVCVIVQQNQSVPFKCLYVSNVIFTSEATPEESPKEETFDGVLMYWNFNLRHQSGAGEIRLYDGRRLFCPGFCLDAHSGLVDQIRAFQSRLMSVYGVERETIEKPIFRVSVKDFRGKLQVKQIYAHSFQNGFERVVSQNVETVSVPEPVVVPKTIVSDIEPIFGSIDGYKSDSFKYTSWAQVVRRDAIIFGDYFPIRHKSLNERIRRCVFDAGIMAGTISVTFGGF